jgi:DNA-binding CsgD family transcriptional regulator
MVDVKRLVTQTRIHREIVEGVRESHCARNSNDRESHLNQVAPDLAVTKRQSSARDSTAKRDVALWVNWQLGLYLLVLGWTCLVLVPLTNFWWLALVCGMAMPIALAALNKPDPAPKRLDEWKLKERELLETLAERGELTPTTVAVRTSLTVEEASEMLEGLARKGHLELQMENGIEAYALWEHDRRQLSTPSETESESDEAASRLGAQRLDDPLSGRELEVLALLASGRTNAEIARNLFVAIGTVKSHAGNIYRKLDAKNRAEALGRARELKLLP